MEQGGTCASPDTHTRRLAKRDRLDSFSLREKVAAGRMRVKPSD
ncbi:MAG: hypothetical protein QF927_09135 [Verrucomicrobiota bacterium]|nr:hypothetical protein [Verrucomicrobiota bacterium]MDP7014133.1 hypothetical protein [Verrucomicrobiota bacterium]